MPRPFRQVRTVSRYGVPLCQTCFTPEFDGPHDNDLCIMRVVAALHKAVHNLNLWQDRYNALSENPDIDPEVVVGHAIGQSLFGSD